MRAKNSLAAITAFLALAGPASTVAARASTSAGAILEGAPPGTVLRDDDDGRVEVTPRASVPLRKPSFHGGPVIEHPAVRALFLGSGWRDSRLGAQEGRALEAVTHAPAARTVVREDLLDPLNGTTVSDLEIQRRLADWIDGRTAEAAKAGAVYVVFLAPGIEATLGPSRSSRDFAAYHNRFHAKTGVVRYVVVPYDADAARWLANGRRSFVQTLIDPDGNGWY